MIDLTILGLVLIAAMIASLNPCSIGIVNMVMSVTLGDVGRRKKAIWLFTRFTSAFLDTIFLLNLLIGLLTVWLISLLPTVAVGYLALVVALMLAIAGLLEIKDFFWYGKGFSLRVPRQLADRLHRYATEKKSLLNALRLGGLATLAGLSCSGITYLGILTFIGLNSDLSAGTLLIIYNLVLILPPYFILALAAGRVKISHVIRWHEETKHYLRLYIGLLLISLAWLIVLTTNSAINLG